MALNDLLEGLMHAQTLDAARAIVDQLEAQPGVSWFPLGGRQNNRGTVDIATNPGRALVERVTNAVDAVLERAHDERQGKRSVSSPREAASSWFGVPKSGLAGLAIPDRQSLADNVVVLDEPGDSKELRILSIRDQGIGLSRTEMPNTILSLNESNKISKRYVSGTYGQGGSATFACCHLSLIASRKAGTNLVAFTVVKYEDLPPEQFKTGRYVYLVAEDGLPFETSADVFGAAGTFCRHMGFDLSGLDSPVGPNSVYGLLGQVLFDPILPIWAESTRHSWRRRTIQGARNSLLGAVDEGDEDKGKVEHQQTMFYPDLGDFGQVGIEYWLLAQPDPKKRPSAGYVDPSKPVIITWNGQNQAEMTHNIITKQASLPLFKNRLIIHVDADRLSPAAHRALFTSGREEARSGAVMSRIQQEVLEALKSDDKLHELHRLAQEALTKQTDVGAEQAMRKEVAKLLKMQGFDVPATGTGSGVTGPEPPTPRPPKPPKPIVPFVPCEPPTFVRIAGPEDKPIAVYPDRSKHLTIFTDADSSYHSVDKPNDSKINVIVTPEDPELDAADVKLGGSTDLSGGRMRALLRCAADAKLGTFATVTVELYRRGLPTLSDTRRLMVDTPPEPPGKGSNRVLMPPFRVEEIGPNDDMWDQLEWPTDNQGAVASTAMDTGDVLVVYFSNVFPPFVNAFKNLAATSKARAESFQNRYSIWLAAHSLIIARDQKNVESDGGEAMSEEAERSERCRYATMAAMFAHQEVLQAAATMLSGAGDD